MSPNFSDYRSDEFGYDEQELNYSRQGNSDDVRPAPRPSNMPSRSSKRRLKSNKSTRGHNGIQRRRNNHWSW